MGAAADPLQTASQHGSHPAGQFALPRQGTRLPCPLQYCMCVFKVVDCAPASTIPRRARCRLWRARFCAHRGLLMCQISPGAG